LGVLNAAQPTKSNAAVKLKNNLESIFFILRKLEEGFSV